MKNNYYPFHSLVGGLFRIKVLSFLILSLCLISFSAQGQNQTKEYYQTKLKSNTTVGYLSYLPPAYQNSSEDFPVMVFLHGMGETGSNLDKLLYYGPPNLIRWGNWPAERPLIVISPQNPSAFGSSWNPDLVDEVISEISAKYRVDKNRIYVTGTSMGGNGAWNYASKYPNRLAAVVPICGWGTPSNACNMKNVPTWAFHNSADPMVNVSGTNNMIDALEKCGPSPWPKKTIYQQSGHDAWTKTYNLTAGHDIYSWMLSYNKGGSKPPVNKNPTVNAGSDKTITLPQNSISLTGSASDSDGSISSYAWSKLNGPSASMSNTSSATLNLSNLVQGTYNFRLTVKDNQGAATYDDAKVQVNAASAPPPSPPANGQGLIFSYYEGTWDVLPNFSTLTAKNTGTISNFSLSPKLKSDYYGFQFDGFIDIATAGTYTFYTSSDDGSKLYINAKEVVNNDGLHGIVEKSGSLFLSVGKHQIKVTYFEKNGGDNLTVRYNGPGVSKQTIPNNKLFAQGDSDAKPEPVETTNGLQYKYYEGDWTALPNFANMNAKKTGSISNFSLSPKNQHNNYAFEFDGFINITSSGTYNFYTSSDDGSKLYIGSKEVVNNDGLHAKEEKSGSIYLSAGTHPIKVTYFERWSDDILEVRYSGPGVSKQIIPDHALSSSGEGTTEKPAPPSTAAGLDYKYYEGHWTRLPNFSSLKAKKKGTVSNFSLAPKQQLSTYGFEFEGYIDIKSSGTYNFHLSSDDGSKLYINDKEVVNNDFLHAKIEKSGNVHLSSGKHKIKVTYFEQWADDVLEVRYDGPGVSKQLIPDNVLSRTNEGGTTSSDTNAFGSISKNKISSKANKSEEQFNASVFPNPFVETLNVSVSNSQDGIVTISLTDLTGNVIFKDRQSLNSLAGTLSIDMFNKNIPNGVYVLQVISGTDKKVMRIVKK